MRSKKNMEKLMSAYPNIKYNKEKFLFVNKPISITHHRID